jgi:hypothetical protein
MFKWSFLYQLLKFYILDCIDFNHHFACGASKCSICSAITRIQLLKDIKTFGWSYCLLKLLGWFHLFASCAESSLFFLVYVRCESLCVLSEICNDRDQCLSIFLVASMYHFLWPFILVISKIWMGMVRVTFVNFK